MRDEGKFQAGDDIEHPPKMFIGAAINPFADPFEWRVHRLAKKVEAGADFVQTQYCFDVPRLRQFLNQVCDMGLDESVFILIGVVVLAAGESVQGSIDNDGN